MKKFAVILILAFVLFSACEKRKPDVEVSMPSAPPHPDLMQPTSDPPL